MQKVMAHTGHKNKRGRLGKKGISKKTRGHRVGVGQEQRIVIQL